MIKRPFFSLTKPVFKYSPMRAPKDELTAVPVPDHLILLLDEPIDSGKIALIKKGDIVKKGEKLSLYPDSDVYTVSPAAGVITQLDIFLDASGQSATYLIIKTDQEDAGDDTSVPGETLRKSKNDIDAADQYLRTLPGEPPLKQLNRYGRDIDTLVITCTDSDLMETTSQFVALRLSDEIKQGAQILKKLTNASRICITAPEDSKIKEIFDTMQVFETSGRYPANLPSMILKDHLNLILPPGGSPEDIGVCFIKAEAVVSLGKVYKKGATDFVKHLAVIGREGNVHRVTATIGTSLGNIFKSLDIRVNDGDRVIIGGPMQGVATYTMHHPVTPDMDTVIIQDSGTVPAIEDNACINCGKCIQVCPVNVPVNILVRYLEADQYEEAADQYDLESCIDCGLCAYVCTAKIALCQHIKLGKLELARLKASSEEMEAVNE